MLCLGLTSDYFPAFLKTKSPFYFFPEVKTKVNKLQLQKPFIYRCNETSRIYRIFLCFYNINKTPNFIPQFKLKLYFSFEVCLIYIVI